MRKLRYISFLFITFLIGVLVSCDGGNSGEEYSFERSVQEVVVEKRCLANETNPHKECYLLKWRYPVDTDDLKRFHIWLDTTVIGLDDQEVPSGALKESITQDFVARENIYYDSLDISDYLLNYENRDSLTIAMFAEYSSSGLAGRLVRTFVILGDDQAPARIQFYDSTDYHRAVLTWMRPTDQVDFYKADSLSGEIVGYNVHFWTDDGKPLRRTIQAALMVAGDTAQKALFSSQRWRALGDSLFIDSVTSGDDEKHWAVQDGQGFMGDTLKDRFVLILEGLESERQYQVNFVAYDRAGNYSQSETRLIATTDSLAPLMGTRFYSFADSVDAQKIQVDTTRIKIYWPLALDPLIPTTIKMDSIAHIPTGCYLGACFNLVTTYEVQTFRNGEWLSIDEDESEINYTQYYTLGSNISPVSSLGNDYSHLLIGDTIGYLVPGDTLILRVRGIDASGGVSSWLQDTLYLGKGYLENYECPEGFLPVPRRSGVDTTQGSLFCIETYEHRNTSGDIEHHLLAQEARTLCQSMSTDEFTVDLCPADDWLSACVAKGLSRYGTIEESPFYPSEFLQTYCNLGTGDSLQAYGLSDRDERCVTPHGIHDMPAQLQEWAWDVEKTYDSLTQDTLVDTVFVLKGSSFVEFNVSDRSLLAKCTAISKPHRIRPKYTQDTVYLYRNGSLLDTLLEQDTSRTLYATLKPGNFPDTLIVFEVRDHLGQVLGEDLLDFAEYKRRGGMAWIDAISEGLDYVQVRYEQVLILGEESADWTAPYYRDNSIGFRCCSNVLQMSE